ncbi:DNA-binding protein [Zavarzinia compransoris]|uniref:DNA-binding protein n=2 Tax=Zavarzinia compransoris TaxID=1264899 RepID=A0A317EAG1_9PROT|nr:DNA-binding protein [Zavarzinia compransoris]
MRLMDKAVQACSSARLLLNHGDRDGACNRAYYAMFDAGCAVLAKFLPHEKHGKSHAGVINAFSLHFVKTGLVGKDLGRSLKRAEEMRLIADYRGGVLDSKDVEIIIDRAEYFIETLRGNFFLE